MTEENGWGSAIKGLWGSLLRGGGALVTLRWVLLTLFAVGFLWSLALFIGMTGYSETSPAIHLPNMKSGTSTLELSALVGEVKAVSLARGSALFSANTPARRYPFAPVPEESRAISFGAAVGGDALVSYREPVYIEPMPPMTVKGVMVMGDRAVAVISIGDEEGILVEAGYRFGGGKGKIESISFNKVVVSWMGEREEIYVTP